MTEIAEWQFYFMMLKFKLCQLKLIELLPPKLSWKTHQVFVSKLLFLTQIVFTTVNYKYECQRTTNGTNRHQSLDYFMASVASGGVLCLLCSTSVFWDISDARWNGAFASHRHRIGPLQRIHNTVADTSALAWALLFSPQLMLAQLLGSLYTNWHGKSCCPCFRVHSIFTCIRFVRLYKM